MQDKCRWSGIAIVESLGEHEEEKWDDQGGKTIVDAGYHDIGNAAGKCQGAIYPYTVSEEPMADEYGDEDADDGYQLAIPEPLRKRPCSFLFLSS